MDARGNKDADHAVTAFFRTSLSAVIFALQPTFAALMAHAPHAAPRGLVLIRAVLFTALAVLAVCLFLIRLGSPPRVAAAAVAVGTGVFGLFPPVRFLLLREMSPELAQIFAICYVAGCIALTLIIVRLRPHPSSSFYPATNIFAAVLGIFMLHLAWQAYGPGSREAANAATPQGPATAILTGHAPARRPDVYHIILDGLGRPDVLRAQYGLDLSDVVGALRNRGFAVSDDIGAANYVLTALSVSSLLNVQYLDSLADEDETSMSPLYELIQRSSVMEAFKRLDYQIDFIGSIFPATATHRLADTCHCNLPFIGEFESTIIRETPWSDIGLAGIDHWGHREKIRRSFTTLESLPRSTRPRFALAHIMAPHPPFVFDEYGRNRHPPRTFSIDDGSAYRGPRSEYEAGYRDQARYIANRLLEVIDHIDHNARDQGRIPIIIVHGDHGPRWRWNVEDVEKTDASESLPVFMAIRWAEVDRPHIAPKSLVNIYRTLFRLYFNSKLDLLPDRHFVASFSKPYRFIEIDMASMGAVGRITPGSR